MSNVNAEIKMQGNNDAWFTTNAAVVYPANVVIYHTDGRYKYTDGVTALSALTFRGAGGSATWGGITGTLSNQTDLQTVLNNKEPLKGSDDNYVTDAQLVVIGNTSGTNTGDNAANTTSNTYADGKVADSITNGVTTIAPSQNAVFDALALKATIAQLPYDISYYKKTGAATFKQYYTQALNASAFSTLGTARNTSYYFPYIVSKTTTIEEIGMHLTGAGTAGSVLIIGIYDSLDMLPNNLVLTAGTILGDSATAQLITGVNTILTPGLYYLYINHNSVANITVRALSGSAVINLGHTSSLGTTSITFFTVGQAYSGTLTTTALGTLVPTSSVVPALYMYFSS